jgi:hypothetical protein
MKNQPLPREVKPTPKELTCEFSEIRSIGEQMDSLILEMQTTTSYEQLKILKIKAQKK